ncbi:uncharacterized protein LOC125369163 [Ricinus communis]|uniref:uncharacterized protein LOC125369163 n=1 Tax=Ricinus communis TaxID=3988 RepID=UPI00201AA324|nr:uncharacterized protein LOC125369163 [Ricinus communis]
MDEHSTGPVGSHSSVHAHHIEQEQMHENEQSQGKAEGYAQQIAEELRRLAQQQPPPPLNVPALDANFGKLRKHGGKEFEGTTDPIVAEEWLKSVKGVFTQFNTQPTTQMKVRYATSLFLKDARNWWETVPGSQTQPLTMTWEEFLKEFKMKYMPPIYQERKKLEFLELKQNEMSVADYELQFTRLSRYAPEEVATDELKRNRFERGLRLEIREKLAVQPPTFIALLEAATRAEELFLERNILEAKKKK